LGCDFEKQRIVNKNFRGRKSGQAMAGPAGPPTTALIGHARQRHHLIGCSETRTVGAQSVRAL